MLYLAAQALYPTAQALYPTAQALCPTAQPLYPTATMLHPTAQALWPANACAGGSPVLKQHLRLVQAQNAAANALPRKTARRKTARRKNCAPQKLRAAKGYKQPTL